MKKRDKINTVSEILIYICDIHADGSQLLVDPLRERLLLHLNPSSFFDYAISGTNRRNILPGTVSDIS